VKWVKIKHKEILHIFTTTPVNLSLTSNINNHYLRLCDFFLSHFLLVKYSKKRAKYGFYWVNRQLPLWNCKFPRLPYWKFTKLQLSPWNCTTLINLPSRQIFLLVNMMFCKSPPWSFALMCKIPLELDFFFLFLSFSKDIKGKQLTVNFNNLNSTILQSKIQNSH